MTLGWPPPSMDLGHFLPQRFLNIAEMLFASGIEHQPGPAPWTKLAALMPALFTGNISDRKADGNASKPVVIEFLLGRIIEKNSAHKAEKPHRRFASRSLRLNNERAKSKNTPRALAKQRRGTNSNRFKT